MKDDRPYLADVLQALERVEEIGRRGREAFLADWLLQDAAIRNFEIVGEAVKRVSPVTQAAHPGIPLADLAGFRDVLIHQYFRVDLEIVWALIEQRVAALRGDVARVVAALAASG
ncbi:MAG TPA: HepT-like ribonuclease domain-containing protein [Anaeromyxobacteraceae bacterium]|nr:HepT-like ribonuclease domain-containing protein [Anaeromyxobacteraceae bacterium]